MTIWPAGLKHARLQSRALIKSFHRPLILFFLSTFVSAVHCSPQAITTGNAENKPSGSDDSSSTTGYSSWTDTMIASISKITDNIYMSGCQNLQETTLKNLGIIFVVNCTQEVPLLRSTTIDTVRLGLEDSPYSNIGMYFDRMTDRIQEATKKGKVLVHCVAGVSRSASLVLAYLVKHHNMSLKDAHALVRSKRPIIRPNSGFWQQLVDFERQVRGTNSVKMVQTHYGAQPDLYQSEISSSQLSVQPLSTSVSSSYVVQRTPLSPRSNTPPRNNSSTLRSSSSYTDMLLQLSRDQRSTSQTLLYRYPNESSGRWGTRLPSTLPPVGSRNSPYLPTFYRFL